MASHRECPLNTDWDEDDPACLSLYISRDFWRYYVGSVMILSDYLFTYIMVVTISGMI